MIGFILDVITKVYNKRKENLIRVLFEIAILFNIASITTGIEHDLTLKFPTYQKISKEFAELQLAYYTALKTLGEGIVKTVFEVNKTLIFQLQCYGVPYEIPPQWRNPQWKNRVSYPVINISLKEKSNEEPTTPDSG